MENATSSALQIWVNVLERDGWLLINLEDRKLGILISMTEAGKEYLRVAGFHLGETMFVGERRNILSARVEPISVERHEEMLPKIQEALPHELRGLPIIFL
jgi:hypothetical protein